MLMVAILNWGKDLIFKQADSIESVHNLKRRLNLENADYIIFDGVLLCPICLDHANYQLDEEEQLEWFMTSVYPALEAEGRMSKKNGKWVRVQTHRNSERIPG